MKRLAEVTDAKAKAEQEALKYREQLEKEAEAKRLLMENNRMIETKYKEIESMVQKVRHQPNLIQDNSRTMVNPSIPQNETLIEVQDVSDFPAIPNSTMRIQPRGNTKFQA